MNKMVHNITKSIREVLIQEQFAKFQSETNKSVQIKNTLDAEIPLRKGKAT